MDLEVVAASRVGGDEGPRALADVVLDDDVGGRAELLRQGDRVAAAQLEVPGLGDPAAERIDVAEVGAAIARGRLAVRCGSNRAAHPSLQQNAMTPLLALHAATTTLPVRWDATLLSGGWLGSPEDDLLPAAGLLIDAGFDGGVALAGTRRFVVDHRRLVRGPAGATSALVADLVARVERGDPETPTRWCERAAVFAPDAVTEELDELLGDSVGSEDCGALAPALGRGGRCPSPRGRRDPSTRPRSRRPAGGRAPAVPAEHRVPFEGERALEARVDEQARRGQQVVVGAAAPAAAEQGRLPAHGERGRGGVESEQRRHRSAGETGARPDRFRGGRR